MRLPLSDTEALILSLLQDGHERYGLELVARSDGALKRGTVYVTIQRMEDKGYVTTRTEVPPAPRSGPPRRLVRCTAFGLQQFGLARQIAGILQPVGGEVMS